MELDGFQVDKVYGNPDSPGVTGSLIKISTLFASPVDKEGRYPLQWDIVSSRVKGGILLVKLKPKELQEISSCSRKVIFTISYEDRAGMLTKWSEEMLVPPKFIEEVC